MLYVCVRVLLYDVCCVLCGIYFQCRVVFFVDQNLYVLVVFCCFPGVCCLLCVIWLLLCDCWVASLFHVCIVLILLLVWPCLVSSVSDLIFVYDGVLCV